MASEEIDVRYEPVHEAPMMRDGRPMLVWTGRHPVHGYSGWTLYYLDDPVSDSPGVEITSSSVT